MDHSDAEGSPYLPHDLAQLARTCFPALGSANSCTPGLGKGAEKVVKVSEQVAPRPSHQLAL